MTKASDDLWFSEQVRSIAKDVIFYNCSFSEAAGEWLRDDDRYNHIGIRVYKTLNIYHPALNPEGICDIGQSYRRQTLDLLYAKPIVKNNQLI